MVVLGERPRRLRSVDVIDGDSYVPARRGSGTPVIWDGGILVGHRWALAAGPALVAAAGTLNAGEAGAADAAAPAATSSSSSSSSPMCDRLLVPPPRNVQAGVTSTTVSLTWEEQYAGTTTVYRDGQAVGTTPSTLHGRAAGRRVAPSA